jgi:Ca2+-transporting ATPase
MALLLLGAVLVAVQGGRIALGLVIWGVVGLNALFSFWQEFRAERAITELKHLLPAYARVLRANSVSPGRACWSNNLPWWKL